MRGLLRFLDDLLLLAGCACVLIGLAQLSIPATWITGGIMLGGLWVLVEKAMNRRI